MSSGGETQNLPSKILAPQVLTGFGQLDHNFLLPNILPFALYIIFGHLDHLISLYYPQKAKGIAASYYQYNIKRLNLYFFRTYMRNYQH